MTSGTRQSLVHSSVASVAICSAAHDEFHWENDEADELGAAGELTTPMVNQAEEHMQQVMLGPSV